MMKREDLAKDWRGTLGSVEPHFDDERTILSAQPVIPLEKVEKVHTRRVWMFVGAFVVASLLGSGAALALIEIRQPAAIQVATESEATEQPVAQVPNASEQTAESSSTEANPSVELPDDARTQEVSVAEPPKRIQQTNRHASEPAPVRVTIKTSRTTARGDDEDQPRLIDQWQERRQRRVNRAKSPSEDHHSSDLFRIREIFEGPRRGRTARN